MCRCSHTKLLIKQKLSFKNYHRTITTSMWVPKRYDLCVCQTAFSAVCSSLDCWMWYIKLFSNMTHWACFQPSSQFIVHAETMFRLKYSTNIKLLVSVNLEAIHLLPTIFFHRLYCLLSYGGAGAYPSYLRAKTGYTGQTTVHTHIHT